MPDDMRKKRKRGVVSDEQDDEKPKRGKRSKLSKSSKPNKPSVVTIHVDWHPQSAADMCLDGASWLDHVWRPMLVAIGGKSEAERYLAELAQRLGSPVAHPTVLAERERFEQLKVTVDDMIKRHRGEALSLQLANGSPAAAAHLYLAFPTPASGDSIFARSDGGKLAKSVAGMVQKKLDTLHVYAADLYCTKLPADTLRTCKRIGKMPTLGLRDKLAREVVPALQAYAAHATEMRLAADGASVCLAYGGERETSEPELVNRYAAEHGFVAKQYLIRTNIVAPAGRVFDASKDLAEIELIVLFDGSGRIKDLTFLHIHPSGGDCAGGVKDAALFGDGAWLEGNLNVVAYLASQQRTLSRASSQFYIGSFLPIRLDADPTAYAGDGGEYRRLTCWRAREKRRIAHGGAPYADDEVCSFLRDFLVNNDLFVEPSKRDGETMLFAACSAFSKSTAADRLATLRAQKHEFVNFQGNLVVGTGLEAKAAKANRTLAAEQLEFLNYQGELVIGTGTEARAAKCLRTLAAEDHEYVQNGVVCTGNGVSARAAAVSNTMNAQRHAARGVFRAQVGGSKHGGRANVRAPSSRDQGDENASAHDPEQACGSLRAPPPQQLSLYHPSGDASLAPLCRDDAGTSANVDAPLISLSHAYPESGMVHEQGLSSDALGNDSVDDAQISDEHGAPDEHHAAQARAFSGDDARQRDVGSCSASGRAQSENSVTPAADHASTGRVAKNDPEHMGKRKKKRKAPAAAAPSKKRFHIRSHLKALSK